ncbi:MAG: UDP-N-acetylmuramate dehydrogenase [Burkholderiaceae bacterium]
MSLQLLRNAPLQALNTFGLPAMAGHLIRVEQTADLPALPALLEQIAADAPGEPVVLGGGSNWLPLGSIEQPVVHMQIRGRERLGAHGLIDAAAGESWDALVHWSLEQGLAGLENLALIPGTVGGAPIQNIGAYGVELASCFDSLEAMHLSTGEQRRFDAAECGFAYRESIFKHGEGRGWLITSVRLRLRPEAGAPLHLDYGDVRAWLRDAGIQSPCARDVARAVSAIRRSKLPDPQQLGNAGSFFKNPVVPEAQARALKAAYPDLPLWPVETGSEVQPETGWSQPGSPSHGGDRPSARLKLAAAWLIDQCGWKGQRQGQAGVHARHALVLVNHGGATGDQVLALARSIQDSVQARFGVLLEPEPRLVGASRLNIQVPASEA